MTPLTRDALETEPMNAESVNVLFLIADDVAAYEVEDLCVSHERLRMELEGAQKLLAESEAKIKMALALTDTGSAEFVEAFPFYHLGSGAAGWRIVERIRAVLLGETK